MFRKRNSEQVRIDAIKMGVKKARSGCDSCSNGYFELAKQNGATEDEIKQVLEAASDEPGELLMSRRKLLKGTVAAGAALVLAGTLEGLIPKGAEAFSHYWGVDSLTNLSHGAGWGAPQFYIGRFGSGTASNWNYFSPTDANAAGECYTYDYWDLEGPGAKPSGSTAYQWGQKQANAAFNTWVSNTKAQQYIGGTTIFADIEKGNYGWSGTSISSSQDVLNGWQDAMASNSGFPMGLYFNLDSYDTLFGSGFNFRYAAVIYIARCVNLGCSPCDASCNTKTSAGSEFDNHVSSTTRGQCQPVVWQYWQGSSSSCGDWDLAVQRPSCGAFSARTVSYVSSTPSC